MDRNNCLDLLEEVGSDEHSWIDFKEDYEVSGIAMKKAEFIKDIASLANTVSERDQHYILIGINDEGQLTGIDNSRIDYRGEGPRHIFSLDESDIQEIVDEYLMPTPRFSFHRYEKDSKKFGAIVIKPLSEPPCLIDKDLYDSGGTQCLHEGRIYVRHGSGKKIADIDDLGRIIDHRVQQRREDILSGIRKVVDLGPDFVEQFATSVPEGADIVVTTSGGEKDEADFKVQERLSRTPASTLDEQLNGDIAQWMGRGDDFIGSKALWEYYGNPSQLTIDKESVLFLTQSSLKNHTLGVFWLSYVDSVKIVNVLTETPQHHHRLVRAAKIAVIKGDSELLEDIIDISNTESGEFQTCRQKVSNTEDYRLKYVMKNKSYKLKHDGWRRNFEPKSLEKGEIIELIPEIGTQLKDIQEILDEESQFWNRRNNFRSALFDLEAVLAYRIFNNHTVDP